MLVAIAAVYAVFTLPYHVTWLFSVFGYPNSVAKKLCVLLVMATSAAHPIIYGTLNQEFGKGFKAFFKCTKERKRRMKNKETREARVKLSPRHRGRRFANTEKARGVSSQVSWTKTQRAQFATLNYKACDLQKENEIFAETVSCL